MVGSWDRGVRFLRACSLNGLSGKSSTPTTFTPSKPSRNLAFRVRPAEWVLLLLTTCDLGKFRLLCEVVLVAMLGSWGRGAGDLVCFGGFDLVADVQDGDQH